MECKIPMSAIVELKSSEIKDYIEDKLIKAGFNLNKPITGYEDLASNNYIYNQD